MDDIIIIGSSLAAIKQLISTLSTCFALKDLSPLQFFLGVQVTHTGDLHLSQQQYITDLLRRTNMNATKPLPTPMQTNLRLQKDASSAMHDPSMFRSVVSALQYVIFTRLKLSYVVNKVCQFMHSPQDHHWKAIKRILRYLGGTRTHGLILQPKPSPTIRAFSDADWGSDVDHCKSTTGYCVYYGRNLIAWSSHKQRVVSCSNIEAKYRSIAAVLTEVLRLQSLLHELHLPTSQPQLFSDNLGVVLLSANPIMHSRTKHFELDLHFVKDYVQQHKISLVHLPARFQIADILTKSISGPAFLDFRCKLMVGVPPTSV